MGTKLWIQWDPLASGVFWGSKSWCHAVAWHSWWRSEHEKGHRTTEMVVSVITTSILLFLIAFIPRLKYGKWHSRRRGLPPKLTRCEIVRKAMETKEQNSTVRALLILFEFSFHNLLLWKAGNINGFGKHREWHLSVTWKGLQKSERSMLFMLGEAARILFKFSSPLPVVTQLILLGDLLFDR